MSHRGIILSLSLAVLALAGCSNVGTTAGLESREVEYLSEDVVDLMTNVFQASENAYVGDLVYGEDIVDTAGPGNDFAVTYDLPSDWRLGLGYGYGRVTLRVEEEGQPVEHPLSFSFATTGALEVELEYQLTYLGETPTRDTDIDLLVTAVATRHRAGEPFLVDYTVDGHCFFGDTLCRIETYFRALGRPREGILTEHSDGWGSIDDFDVYDVFDMNLDYRGDFFRAEGRVGWRGYYEEAFGYEEVW
jgi:hypothetical protein